MPEQYAEVCYQKNFLKEVIARVDFLDPLSGVDSMLPPRLTDIAISSFPIAEPRDTVQRAVAIDQQGGVQSSEERFKEWLFHGKERTKTLTIGRQVVLVQHRAYQRYEAVKTEFTEVLDRVADLFPDAQPSRVGLRYVNTIELQEDNPTRWSHYLVPELLSLFEFPPEDDKPALSRVFADLELALDAFQFRFQFGMHNPDYPARIRQKVFVLDLDAYTQSAVDVKDVHGLLDDFHGTIQRYFEQSITDGLRAVLNGD